jgi:hypothetical protein
MAKRALGRVAAPCRDWPCHRATQPSDAAGHGSNVGNVYSRGPCPRWTGCSLQRRGASRPAGEERHPSTHPIQGDELRALRRLQREGPCQVRSPRRVRRSSAVGRRLLDRLAGRVDGAEGSGDPRAAVLVHFQPVRCGGDPASRRHGGGYLRRDRHPDRLRSYARHGTFSISLRVSSPSALASAPG